MIIIKKKKTYLQVLHSHLISEQEMRYANYEKAGKMKKEKK